MKSFTQLSSKTTNERPAGRVTRGMQTKTRDTPHGRQNGDCRQAEE